MDRKYPLLHWTNFAMGIASWAVIVTVAAIVLRTL
jgi:hypothetical protein